MVFYYFNIDIIIMLSAQVLSEPVLYFINLYGHDFKIILEVIMAFCTSCGFEHSPTAKFCNNCGTPIATTTPTPQSTETKIQSPCATPPLITPTTQEMKSFAQQKTEVPLEQPVEPVVNTWKPPAQATTPIPVETPIEQPVEPTVNEWKPPMQEAVTTPTQPTKHATSGQWPPSSTAQAQTISGSWPPSDAQQNFQNQAPIVQPTQPVQPQPPQYQYTQPPIKAQVPTTQQNFTPPPNANNGSVATKKAPNKLIFVFIGLAIVAVLFISLIIFVVSQFFGSSDENTKFYTATELNMFGMALSPTDIYEDGIALELKDNGKCVLKMDGESYNAEWEVNGNTFILSQGSDEFTGTSDGNIIKITNLMNMGLDITFMLDGANTSGTSDSTNGTIGGDTATAPFIAPGYGTEQTFAAETIALPSDWYGMTTISNYKGSNNLSGDYESWGYIGEDDNGIYFELYLNGTFADESRIGLMSFNIELHDYSFFPIVDGYDWLYNNATLKEEDNTWFNPVLQNGVLSATYDYNFEGESFTIDFQLSQIGTASTSDVNTSGEVGGAQTATGEFDFSMENLWAIYESGDLSDLETIDEITAYFGGIEPIYDEESFDEGDTLLPYSYYASDNPEASIHFGFKEENGVLMKKSVSTNIRYFIEGGE